MEVRELLKGERIRLSAFSEDDIKSLKEWYGDSVFLRYYDIEPALPQSETQLIEMVSDIRKSNDKYIFSIRYNEDDKLIGICGYENIMWSNGTATLYIGLGNKEHRGKGLAREALKLIIDFGFLELNFHRIQLNVISYNEAAISLYEKSGFIREGISREFVERDDKSYDLYNYGLLRREWLNR